MASNESIDNVLELLEEISKTSKSLSQENQEIKAQLQESQQRDEANRKALETITAKLSNAASSHNGTAATNRREARRQSAKERRGIIPAQCRVSTIGYPCSTILFNSLFKIADKKISITLYAGALIYVGNSVTN